MDEIKYPISKSLKEYIRTLLRYAYKEIGDADIHIEWGKTHSFAVVIWQEGSSPLIRCNRSVRKWTEPALFGLLSHELSHIVLGSKSHSECQTDVNVIKRGLGPYLAVERIFADKYRDHVIQKGRDRYLGYDSIRSLLTKHEERQLDVLMTDIGILPKKGKIDLIMHDYTFHQIGDMFHIVVNGQSFCLDGIPDIGDIKFINEGTSVQIVYKNRIIGQFEN